MPTPKNTHTGDIRYTELAPIFASGAERLVVTVNRRYNPAKSDFFRKKRKKRNDPAADPMIHLMIQSICLNDPMIQ